MKGVNVQANLEISRDLMYQSKTSLLHFSITSECNDCSAQGKQRLLLLMEYFE